MNLVEKILSVDKVYIYLSYVFSFVLISNILCKHFDEKKSADIPDFFKQIDQNIRKRYFISE
jgi:hypothetical protein